MSFGVMNSDRTTMTAGTSKTGEHCVLGLDRNQLTSSSDINPSGILLIKSAVPQNCNMALKLQLQESISSLCRQ